MTNLVDYTARFLNTAEAMDYTPDELDDLTSRKVEAVEFDSDALARLVRARRGTARYLNEEEPYAETTDDAHRRAWRSPHVVVDDDMAPRRMAAVGTGGHGTINARFVL